MQGFLALTCGIDDHTVYEKVYSGGATGGEGHLKALFTTRKVPNGKPVSLPEKKLLKPQWFYTAMAERRMINRQY